jgi:CRISPR/Cas system-associated exonuclease Cas4 (RecB family)
VSDVSARIAPEYLFSQHSLGTYARCPRRFLWRYVDRQPWPAPEQDDPVAQEAFLERGRIFHQWMARRLLGVPSEAIAMATDDADLARWWNAAKGFPGHALPAGLREAELPVVVGVGAHRLYARYDLLALDPGGRAVIVDWKTLEHRPNQRHLRSRLQTRIYLYTLVAAGQAFTGGAPVNADDVSMLYWFANHPDAPEWIPYSRREYEADAQRLEDLIAHISAMRRDEFAPTDNPRLCPCCQYRTLCECDGDKGDADEEAWVDEEIDFRLDLAELPELEH